VRLNGEIPVGGHVDPSFIVGKNLLWKNAQENEVKKRNTSEIMNRIILHRNLSLLFLCVNFDEYLTGKYLVIINYS
jgi:hypothetical protein